MVLGQNSWIKLDGFSIHVVLWSGAEIWIFVRDFWGFLCFCGERIGREQVTLKNSMILNVCPQKFCINIVSIFPRDLQWFQEKIKTMHMKYFGGQTNSITVFFKVAYCHVVVGMIWKVKMTRNWFWRICAVFSISSWRSRNWSAKLLPVRICRSSYLSCDSLFDLRITTEEMLNLPLFLRKRKRFLMLIYKPQPLKVSFEILSL